MSSTILYRFRSQNKNSKVSFDGTGLTVFDLKKEIITVNKMGPTIDFDIGIYNADTGEEYKDDYEVIPRSSYVIVRRFPAVRGTKMNASRYVGGKPRISKSGKANLRDFGDKPVASTTRPVASQAGNMISLNDNNASEEDKINAMFQNQEMAWQETQEMMENATPVYMPRQPAKVEPPPPGYICYRCGSKDHFIKDCTASDATFQGKMLKRTAGIPKSSLKVVDKLPDEEGGSYLLGDDGKFVIALADSKAWETYQKKQNMYKSLSTDSITDKTLIDPTTNKLFQKPVKTPCCHKTYSLDSIEGLLIERDFKCPNCDKPDILLDQLEEDKEMAAKIKEYMEKEAEKNGLKRSDFDDPEDLKDTKRMKTSSLPSRPLAPPSLPGFPAPGPGMPGFPIPGYPMPPPSFMPNQYNSNSQ